MKREDLSLLERYNSFTSGHLQWGDGVHGKSEEQVTSMKRKYLSLLDRYRSCTSRHWGWGNGLHRNAAGPESATQPFHSIYHMGNGKRHRVMGVVAVCHWSGMVPCDADGKAWQTSSVRRTSLVPLESV